MRGFMADVLSIAEAIAPIAAEGVHRGAEVLNSMLQADVALETPNTSVVDPQTLASRLAGAYSGPLAWVSMRYMGDLRGAVELVFGLDDASRLAAVISADLSPGEDSDATRVAVVSEVGNVVINSVVGTLSNALSLRLQFTVPEYNEGDSNSVVSRVQEIEHPKVILVETAFSIAELDIHGYMVLYFSLETLLGLEERLPGERRRL